MTKPIRVALRSTHFKNNPFISDITIVFILYAISPSRVDRGAEMGRNPYIFVPAERVRRARRGTEGAHRAPQTLPRPDRLLILPTPSTHRHTALSPPTAASSYPGTPLTLAFFRKAERRPAEPTSRLALSRSRLLLLSPVALPYQDAMCEHSIVDGPAGDASRAGSQCVLVYVYRSGCCRDTICTSRFNLGSDRISMTKPIRVALRSTHFKNNPFISDITIVFILYAISPSRVDRGAEMGRNPYIFAPARRLGKLE